MKMTKLVILIVMIALALFLVLGLCCAVLLFTHAELSRLRHG